MRTVATTAMAVCFATVMGIGVLAQGGAPGKVAQSSAPKFDPTADPAKDLAAALETAKRTHRRVILDVGGEWCGWCHTMDRFYAEHADLMTLREQNFVWQKINYSPDNHNEGFLSGYPKISGYPHLFVIDSDGKLLQSEDTSLLEEASSYSIEKTSAFLKQWTIQKK